MSDAGMLKAKVDGQWKTIFGGGTSSGGGGGGGGAEEVAVGPDDPIVANPSIELWYDTDEAGSNPDEQRWMSAWGIVGQSWTGGNAQALPTSGSTVIGSVAFVARAGRNYRLKYYLPAVAGNGAYSVEVWANTGSGFFNLTATVGGPWFVGGAVASYFDSRSLEWALDRYTFTDGVTYTIEARATWAAGAAVTIYRDNFYVEDMGPKGGASPSIGLATGIWGRTFLVNGTAISGTSRYLPLRLDVAVMRGMTLPQDNGFVIQVPGAYLVTGQVIYSSGSGGAYISTSIQVWHISAASQIIDGIFAAGTFWNGCPVSGIVQCSAGDIVQLTAATDATGKVVDARSTISIAMVGP